MTTIGKILENIGKILEKYCQTIIKDGRDDDNNWKNKLAKLTIFFPLCFYVKGKSL